MALKSKKDEEFFRDDIDLLNRTYKNLIAISEVIQKNPDNPKLVDSFDSLLNTYFDIEVE